MAKQIVVPRLGVEKITIKPIITAFLLLIVALGAWSSFYTVGTEAQGIVTRFGKYTGTPANPGLHFKLPFGIDQVTKVATRTQQKEEFGFRTVSVDISSRYIDQTQDRSFLNVSQMVTGDLNAAIVQWIVQYRIIDPSNYLFKARNPDETLRDAAEAVVREVVGDRTVDEVLTVGRQEIEFIAREKLQELMGRYELGISIEQIVLQDVLPPEEVKASFNAVNEAQQERERLINEARSEYNQAVPRARGEAEQKIQEAEGYATERVNRAEGDVSKFNAVLAEYVKAPAITRRRIYLETMTVVIPRLGGKIIIDEDANQILPLLQLSAGGIKP